MYDAINAKDRRAPSRDSMSHDSIDASIRNSGIIRRRFGQRDQHRLLHRFFRQRAYSNLFSKCAIAEPNIDSTIIRSFSERA